jgi:lysozyme family protein
VIISRTLLDNAGSNSTSESTAQTQLSVQPDTLPSGSPSTWTEAQIQALAESDIQSLTQADLNWNAFQLPNGGGVGYWASDGNGGYYYFGPEGTLYLDSYPGEVQPGDLSNAVGNVATYQFPSVGLAV